ncbi:hypothetical protein [Actinophytocola oryzae]|uniref:Uncharacterized protein n=1 Tax=Actinophytocola oryzae TaxID=502181 RepID=A0A4R7W4T7_9PSEU|nr:hypothetical protein [Actinophytocola oryzae]TDV57552.1 hypothetical protein CLV71_101423 [Actinophytocola oryzae]
MSTKVTRRALLAGASAGLVLGLPGVAAAQELAYAAFRVVRVRPGEPAQPEITLPAGYEILPGANYSVASRAEYYTFVRGPKAAGIDVRVSWPGVPVRAVVHQETRLDLRRSRDGVSFTLPMTQVSADANQPTLQVWSSVDISPGMYFEIEHNDPDRVAGPWASVAWPEGETRSVVHQLIASYAIWKDSGMTAVAAAKGHRFALMGFETNNTLHADNPPHWHISYNSGPDFNSKTHNPHLWLDTEGRNFYNGMDVTGLGRLKYHANEPAPIYDFVGDANGGRGNLVVTITIRDDGGLDITPPDGPTYSMTAGRDGTLLDEVAVLRDNVPWLRVVTRDLVKLGVTTVQVEGLAHHADSRFEILRYDPLTGVLAR